MPSSLARTHRSIHQRPASSTRLRAVRAPPAIDLDEAIFEALLPISLAAREQDVDVVYEIAPGVGSPLRGDAAGLMKRLTRIAMRALQHLTKPTSVPGAMRQISIRCSRVHSGMAPTSTVLVTVRAEGVTPEPPVYELEATLESTVDAWP